MTSRSAALLQTSLPTFAALLLPLSSLHAADAVDFGRDVKPILESNCIHCHDAEHHKGNLRLDTHAGALKGGKEKGPAIVAGQPEKSPLYVSTTLPASDDAAMPPKGDRLTKPQIAVLKQWITQGAPWPDNLALKDLKRAEPAPSQPAAGGESDTATVTGIFQKIAANPGPAAESDMKAYTTKIPGTDVSFDMVPIRGGEFLMGSPSNEAGRKSDEGPQHKVAISPFWMGKCEVTWNEFELWMFTEENAQAKTAGSQASAADKLVDAVTRPTKPYVDMTFGMGRDGFPAISMTQHAANKYCEWLSAKTGQFYRLPTEAEWEYACRAGTTTAYCFGDDVSKLGDYAWFAKNSDNATHKVGQKKPNPWGLYDMHGNAVEWTLDQYLPDGYSQFKDALTRDPWVRCTKPYPQTVRGGSWQDDPEALRSAARRGSDPNWKAQDPQIPKSIWYHTDAQFLGFRVVRPLKVPSAEEMEKYWNSGVEKE